MGHIRLSTLFYQPCREASLNMVFSLSDFETALYIVGWGKRVDQIIDLY